LYVMGSDIKHKSKPDMKPDMYRVYELFDYTNDLVDYFLVPVHRRKEKSVCMQNMKWMRM
jgi:hypothetical protein